jgi:hypothetical protein
VRSEAPISRHQITGKFQRSKFEKKGRDFSNLKLKFGPILEFGIWYLEFQMPSLASS